MRHGVSFSTSRIAKSPATMKDLDRERTWLPKEHYQQHQTLLLHVQRGKHDISHCCNRCNVICWDSKSTVCTGACLGLKPDEGPSFWLLTNDSETLAGQDSQETGRWLEIQPLYDLSDTICKDKDFQSVQYGNCSTSRMIRMFASFFLSHHLHTYKITVSKLITSVSWIHGI